MIPEKMKEVLKDEGVVAIVTEGKEGAHVVNTWNTYIKITEEGNLLAPVGGMNTTESNVNHNENVLVTLGSREVEGFHSMGTGFLINATAKFAENGPEYDSMKEDFPWMRAVLIVKPEKITQTL